MNYGIIYFSNTNNCKNFSEKLQKKINADIIELIPKNKVNLNIFLKYTFCSFLSAFNYKTKLEKTKFDLSKYDHLIIVTPTWFAKLPPSFNTFFYNNKINCNITLVVSCFIEYNHLIKNLKNYKLKGKGRILFTHTIYDRNKKSKINTSKTIEKELKELELKETSDSIHNDLIYDY
ncbi:MAG: flavodoxin family protein [Bacillota bacterium]